MSTVAAEVFAGVQAGDEEGLRAPLERSPELVRAELPARAAPHSVAGCTLLHLAVDAGQAGIVRLLVAAGADLEARNEDGRTALHDAIEYGRREIEELLIESGAEVDICAAAILGRLERLRELLDSDPGLGNDRSTGLSPLGWAAYGNQTATAAELIARGARMDDGELLCAGSVGHVEVGRLLLDHGADPHELHPRAGCNALHAAAGMRYACDASTFVEMLLAAGADPSVAARTGRTALEIAEEGARRQAEGGSVEAEEAKNYAGIAALLRRAMTAGRD